MFAFGSTGILGYIEIYFSASCFFELCEVEMCWFEVFTEKNPLRSSQSQQLSAGEQQPEKEIY